MGGLAFTSRTHSKPKARDEGVGGSKTSSDSLALQAKDDMKCSHNKAPGVLHNPLDRFNEYQ